LSVAFTKEDSTETASEILLPDRLISPHPNLVTEAGLKPVWFRIDCYGTSISLCHSWRSLGESNPCFSLERGQVDPLHDHREESSVMETYGCQSRLGCTSRRDRTSFAPETAQPKRRERDRTETK
jgi:hypothetical protein